MGDDAVADIIRRGWESVSDQGVKIEVIPIDRGAPDAGISRLIEVAKKSDVLAAPLASLADLVAEKSIVPMAGQEVDLLLDQLYPALRNGAARYAAQPYAVPIASALPAILSQQTLGPMESWSQYDTWVKDEAKGAAGEPTAGGWAATMLMWRVAGTTPRWLFDRENFEPQIADQPYVVALEQMVQTTSRYASARQTPEQIWQGVTTSTLLGGIGFPATANDVGSDVMVSDLPSGGEVSKVLFDPLSLVMVLSANCRQTGVSKTFVNWISGGSGSQSTRQQIAVQTPVRADSEERISGAYSVWLADRLQSPLTLAPMQVLSAGKYYQALNEQVERCLDGKSQPRESLAEVASVWRSITKEIGVDKQLRAWRRAQGMRA